MPNEYDNAMWPTSVGFPDGQQCEYANCDKPAVGRCPNCGLPICDDHIYGIAEWERCPTCFGKLEEE